MQPAIDRELTHHQYLRSRLEQEFPDADEETLEGAAFFVLVDEDHTGTFQGFLHKLKILSETARNTFSGLHPLNSGPT